MKLRKRLLIGFLCLVALAGVLWLLGLRLEFRGGGTPRLAFVESNDAQLREIERHRAAQRAQADAAPPSPAPAATPTTSAPAPVRAPLQPSTGADVVPYWTSFRGPNRDGHYREMAVRTSWPAAGLTPLWKEPVGGGYASLVVARGRAFTIEQRGPQEVVAAYDVATGRELWTSSWRAHFEETMGGDGPRATPTWADGVVYALGALGELRCLDEATGRTIWRTNILGDNGATNLPWGMAASPLVVDDAVIVLPGGRNGHSVAAYDRRTGARLWSAQDDSEAYSSPMLATLAGTQQLLVLSATRLMGLAPDRGNLLWSYEWVTSMGINVSQPLVISDTRVFVSSSYGVGAAVVEISPTEQGRFAVREVWRNARMKNKFASSVFLDGFIYGLDEAILTCIDAATGDVKWKGGRYGYGQLVLASGRLIVLTEDGDLALVNATPERHEELARFSTLDGKTWNPPAMAGGILIVRNLREMAAFDLR